jgi:PAS domain-containing protein
MARQATDRRCVNAALAPVPRIPIRPYIDALATALGADRSMFGIVADMEGKYLNVTPAWTVMLGWSESDLVGRSSEWLLHQDDR